MFTKTIHFCGCWQRCQRSNVCHKILTTEISEKLSNYGLENMILVEPPKECFSPIEKITTVSLTIKPGRFNSIGYTTA